jgi:hypothetical protein
LVGEEDDFVAADAVEPGTVGELDEPDEKELQPAKSTVTTTLGIAARASLLRAVIAATVREAVNAIAHAKRAVPAVRRGDAAGDSSRW